jgi:hypothetical protein
MAQEIGGVKGTLYFHEIQPIGSFGDSVPVVKRAFGIPMPFTKIPYRFMAHNVHVPSLCSHNGTKLSIILAIPELRFCLLWNNKNQRV